MELLTLTQLKSRASESPLQARIQAQITGIVEKQTKAGKPYLDIQLSDSLQAISLKLWEDTKAYQQVNTLSKGKFVLAEGSWTQNDYGLNADRLDISQLEASAIDQLLSGDPDLAAFQQQEWDYILAQVDSLGDPRLKGLSLHFIDKFGEHMRRTAAARNYHHARRGGLVEHVAQMMRSANAICQAYQELNRDLLICGILFHDCGKLWENSYPAESFEMPYHLAGELLGHIPMGIELVNHLWRQLEQSEGFQIETPTPSNSEVKLHLQHLIAAHHGEYAFGSPTLPRTPEAAALHYIDNLDAKLEMFRQGYREAPKVAEQIHERHRPLPAKLVTPLPPFTK